MTRIPSSKSTTYGENNTSVPEYFRRNAQKRAVWREREFLEMHPDLNYQTELSRLASSGFINLRKHAQGVLRRFSEGRGKRTSGTQSDRNVLSNALNNSSIHSSYLFVNSTFQTPPPLQPPPSKRARTDGGFETRLAADAEGDSGAGHRAEETVDNEDGQTGDSDAGVGEGLNLDQASPISDSPTFVKIEDDEDDTSAPTPLIPEVVDLSLPSGTTIRTHLRLFDKRPRTLFTTSHILLITDPSLKNTMTDADMTYLNSLVRPLPPAPPFFDDAIAACQPMVKDPLHWPTPPTSCPDDPDRVSIWTYVSTAFLHYSRFSDVLRARGPLHGEAWSDVNIWSVLLDFMVLSSSLVTLDRKEISPCIPTLKVKHDGVVRAVSTAGSSHSAIAFIEVKPMRMYMANHGDDWEKVVNSMMATLTRTRATNPGLVLTGVLCRGMSMTVLRGSMSREGVLVLKEHTLEIELEGLGDVVRLCWRMRLGWEEACLSMKGSRRTMGDDF